MLEWIVWLILFSLLGSIVVMVRYWTDLLKKQDTYHRLELIGFPQILSREVRIIGGAGIHGTLAAVAGVLFGWVLTSLGGLFSPDLGPEPDWTAGQLPNYFFQSAFSVLIFHVAWPAVRNLVPRSPGFLQNFLEQEDSFFSGLSVCLASVSLTAWGVDHEMSFLFVLINGILLLAYAVYRLNLSAARQTVSDRNAPSPSEGETLRGDTEDFSFLEEEEGAGKKEHSGTEF